MRLLGSLFRKKPSIPGAKYKETELTNGNTYDVYTAPSRIKALEFLRATDVMKERTYVIVETPDGNLGKDLIMIFDEGDSQKIEFGIRKPLPSPKKSKTHCTTCGYPVLPASRWPAGVNVKELLLLDQLRDKGVGFYCSTCQTCWCPFCVPTDSPETCQLCGAHMDLYRQ